VGRALVWLGLLLALRPYRNQGVQRFSVASAAFRVIILCLSIAFVPAGVTSSAEHARIVGGVVAWMHVVWCVLLALLCLAKLWGLCVGKRPTAVSLRSDRQGKVRGLLNLPQTWRRGRCRVSRFGCQVPVRAVGNPEPHGTS
jgi:hypothetical protein